MKNITTTYFKPKQGILPIFISDFLDICDPVLSFDKFMEGIDLSKYLKNIPVHDTGRIRYNPVNMLKTVLFGFMSQGYISEIEKGIKSPTVRMLYKIAFVLETCPHALLPVTIYCKENKCNSGGEIK